MKTLAIITARGGSKSIPKKNIKDLCGKPLLAYTVEAAHESKLLTRTILSTDDEEIAAVGKDCGVDIPFMRPAELAEDDSKSMDVVQHALKWFEENEGETYDYLMILQPTSPLRTAEDIDACIKIAEEKGADSVMSMYELDDFAPAKLKRITEEGLIEPLLEDEGKISSRRQDATKVFKRNAAIYLTKTSLIEKGDMFGERSYAYTMPIERSVDINGLSDFELAEFCISKGYGA